MIALTCWSLSTLPNAGIMARPKRMVSRTRASFAGVPLGSSRRLNTPFNGGPLLPSLWHGAQYWP